MSAYTLVDARQSRPRSRLWRRMGLFFAALSVILLAALAWFLSIARSALPEIDGSLPVVGVSAPVSVTRDGQGVPTVEAVNLDDLFFAQGYVTAQDRLFQMDLLRRAASGDLAEIVGEPALEHDRQQRILGIRATAIKQLATFSPEDRRQFDDYARGVNAYIEDHRGHLPLEFRILRYSPRPWSAADSTMIAYQMVETLSTSPKAAITREKILAKLGPELTSELYVNRSWRDHPPGDSGLLDTIPATQLGTSQLESEKGIRDDPSVSLWRPWLEPFFNDQVLPLGSNNWVISGAHTVSGKPLLSNDMHLGHQMPNLWYEAHLRCGDFDVAGVTLPGYPFVIVGHNQRVAWGFTNMMPSVQDAYVERFNDLGQYLTPEGWKEPEKCHEVIRVKGKPDVAFDVLVTRHGPIVSELEPGETRPIALRWTLYDGIRNPFFRIDSAQNWGEFRRAFSEFDAPAQNVVYADVDGNIGYQATGKIPIRAGDGTLPVDGSDNAHEWTGYIPFDKLPSVFNPPSGIIATANARITPENYPYSISTEWEAPWRVDRIHRVLHSDRKFSAADMLTLQTDTYSELDRFVADKIVYVVDHARSPSLLARKAADILRQWNGQMDANSAAPTIASGTRDQLFRLLLEPKLGAASSETDTAQLSWKSYRWMSETVWLENVLTNQPPSWLPQKFPNYDELITAATEQALKDAPKDLDSWRWGPQNSVTIQNPVLGKIPLLGRWTGPGTRPQSGSVYTVKAVRHAHGPSERFTADLSNWDGSTLNTVTGQSGNLLSPYYMDQWRAWYMGYTFALPFSKTAVENAAQHRLMLEPR